MMCLCYTIFFFVLFITILQCLVEVSAVSECLEEAYNDTSLVSPGGVFQFGFFTPDEKINNSIYWGIWYYNQSKPKIVVWVANREKPLRDSNGYLVVKDGRAMILDGKGSTYWSTMGSKNSNKTTPNELLHLETPIRNSTIDKIMGAGNTRINETVHFNETVHLRLCLLDSGNLVLYDRREPRGGNPILWQSFEHPTDTFLSGMSIDGSLDLSSNINLTSWLNHNNPAKGNFTFRQQLGLINEWEVVESGHISYWQSRTTQYDKNALALSGFLFDKSSNSSLQNNARLVMNSTGQIQFWIQESDLSWSLKWSVPKDRCSLHNICGNFGSCSSNTDSCQCLPGFKEQYKGCSPISGPPSIRNDSLNDIFLKLPMIVVGNSTCSVSTEDNCTASCVNDPTCVAYAYGFDCSGPSGSRNANEKRCLVWSNELTNLQMDSPDGITVFVRTTRYDIDPTSRGCDPCGAFIIPYPLSTGKNCGDPSYFKFHCNAETGRVNFSTTSGNFKVAFIDTRTQKFTIQIMHNSCDSRYINLTDSSPFNYLNCNVVKDQPLIQAVEPFIEIDIAWQTPQGPTCSSSSDCNHWPHTTCKASDDGQHRCICRSNFHWNGSKLECTRDVPFSLKVVLPCVAGALAIILVCSAFFVYRQRKRRMGKGDGLPEFNIDDTEGIDVPFLDWENVLYATNNFADANELGTGGFGSVYKGKLADGHEIAVKRLSNVSAQGVEEFRTEVKLIAKLQHRNLVKLIGYCTKANKKILIYEYMVNGSLHSCLFDEQHLVVLDWKKRFDIIVGIARGLLYLHQDSRLRIIHRDLKPSNILLDVDLNPKISDFGIAKIVGGKETEASTARIVGTYGYMSPEYASDGIFSVKSDVFSYGVIILETISGRRNSKIFMLEHGLSLLGHAWKLWNEKKGMELMDTKLKGSCITSEVVKCLHIGLLCVQEDPSDRPSMSTIVHMLSGDNGSLPLAKQPAFMNRKPLPEIASSSSGLDSGVQEILTVSTLGR